MVVDFVAFEGAVNNQNEKFYFGRAQFQIHICAVEWKKQMYFRKPLIMTCAARYVRSPLYFSSSTRLQI